MWFYEGSQLLLQLSGFGMILLMLAGVMFPLWPASMRVGVWYLSIGLLGLIGAFFGLAIIRLIIWCITTVTMRPGIWIFPNLFEDVGFVSPSPNQKKSCEMRNSDERFYLSSRPLRLTLSSRSGHGTSLRQRKESRQKLLHAHLTMAKGLRGRLLSR